MDEIKNGPQDIEDMKEQGVASDVGGSRPAGSIAGYDRKKKYEMAEELSPIKNPLENVRDLDVDAMGKKKTGWSFNPFKRGK